MAVDVSEFYSRTSAMINRGTTYDSLLPQFTSMALRFLEQNYSLEYMLTTDEDFHKLQADVQEYDFPENVKKIKLWRVTKSDGTFIDLEQVDPRDLGNTNDPDYTGSMVPSSFYQKGRDSLVLNVAPTEAYNTVSLFYYEYTDWADVELGDSPWMVVNGESLLLAQTVIFLGPRLRDPRLMELMKDMKETSIRTMALSEEEFVQGDSSPIMQYEDV